MSWGFLFVARTKDEAIAEVERQYYHMSAFDQPPPDALEAIKASIRIIPDTHTHWGMLIYVDASGHIGDSSAGSRQDIRLIRLARDFLAPTNRRKIVQDLLPRDG